LPYSGDWIDRFEAELNSCDQVLAPYDRLP